MKHKSIFILLTCFISTLSGCALVNAAQENWGTSKEESHEDTSFEEQSSEEGVTLMDKEESQALLLAFGQTNSFELTFTNNVNGEVDNEVIFGIKGNDYWYIDSKQAYGERLYEDKSQTSFIMDMEQGKWVIEESHVPDQEEIYNSNFYNLSEFLYTANDRESSPYFSSTGGGAEYAGRMCDEFVYRYTRESLTIYYYVDKELGITLNTYKNSNNESFERFRIQDFKVGDQVVSPLPEE